MPQGGDPAYKYQQGKHVMAIPVQLILRAGGEQQFDAGKKEDILAAWNKRTGERGVNVMFDAEVKSIVGTDQIVSRAQRIEKEIADPDNTLTSNGRDRVETGGGPRFLSQRADPSISGRSLASENWNGQVTSLEVPPACHVACGDRPPPMRPSAIPGQRQ